MQLYLSIEYLNKKILQEIESLDYKELTQLHFSVLFYLSSSPDKDKLSEKALKIRNKKLLEMGKKGKDDLTEEETILLLKLDPKDKHISPELRNLIEEKLKIIQGYYDLKNRLVQKTKDRAKKGALKYCKLKVEIIDKYFEYRREAITRAENRARRVISDTDWRLIESFFPSPLEHTISKLNSEYYSIKPYEISKTDRHSSKVITLYAKRLRNERKQQGFTQEELGEYVGVTGETISRIEKNKEIKSIDTGLLARIARVLNCNPDYFINESAERTPIIINDDLPFKQRLTKVFTIKRTLDRIAGTYKNGAITRLIQFLSRFEDELDEEYIDTIIKLLELRLCQHKKTKV